MSPSKSPDNGPEPRQSRLRGLGRSKREKLEEREAAADAEAAEWMRMLVPPGADDSALPGRARTGSRPSRPDLDDNDLAPAPPTVDGAPAIRMPPPREPSEARTPRDPDRSDPRGLTVPRDRDLTGSRDVAGTGPRDRDLPRDRDGTSARDLTGLRGGTTVPPPRTVPPRDPVTDTGGWPGRVIDGGLGAADVPPAPPAAPDRTESRVGRLGRRLGAGTPTDPAATTGGRSRRRAAETAPDEADPTSTGGFARIRFSGARDTTTPDRPATEAPLGESRHGRSGDASGTPDLWSTPDETPDPPARGFRAGRRRAAEPDAPAEPRRAPDARAEDRRRDTSTPPVRPADAWSEPAPRSGVPYRSGEPSDYDVFRGEPVPELGYQPGPAYLPGRGPDSRRPTDGREPPTPTRPDDRQLPGGRPRVDTGRGRPTGDPRTGGPGAAESWPGDPRSADPRFGDPRGDGPRFGEPRAGGPRSGDSRVGGPPTIGGPRSGEPRIGDLRPGEPRTGDLWAGDPRTGDLRAGDPRTGDLWIGDPRTSDPRTSDPRTSDPWTGDLRPGAPRAGDLRPGDPRTGVSRTGDLWGGDPRTGEIRSDSRAAAGSGPNAAMTAAATDRRRLGQRVAEATAATRAGDRGQLTDSGRMQLGQIRRAQARRKRRQMIAIAAVLLVVLAAAGTGAYLLLGGKGKTDPHAGPSADAAPSSSYSPPPDFGWPVKSNGQFGYAVVTSKVIGAAGTVHTFHVLTETGLDKAHGAVDPADFANEVVKIVSDPRSWIASGKDRFQLVPKATAADFIVELATETTTETLCAAGGFHTNKITSCVLPGKLIVNLTRWMEGADGFATVADYRAYLVNHEIGRELSHGNEACPGAGNNAPVMMEQTIDLQGCVANPYPYLNGKLYSGPKIP